jgi:hypothetical protein
VPTQKSRLCQTSSESTTSPITVARQMSTSELRSARTSQGACLRDWAGYLAADLDLVAMAVNLGRDWQQRNPVGYAEANGSAVGRHAAGKESAEAFALQSSGGASNEKQHLHSSS